MADQPTDSKQILSGRMLRLIPALVLLVVSAAAVLSGIAELGYGLAFGGSGAGAGAVALGLALVVCSLMVGAIGVGILRDSAAAARAGVIVLSLALTASAVVAIRGLAPLGSVVVGGTPQPIYDTRSLAIALAIVPFGIAILCLVLLEIRGHRLAR